MKRQSTKLQFSPHLVAKDERQRAYRSAIDAMASEAEELSGQREKLQIEIARLNARLDILKAGAGAIGTQLQLEESESASAFDGAD